METTYQTISIKGKIRAVPSIKLDNVKIIASGALLTIAAIHEEEWLAKSLLPEPELVIAAIKASHFKADIFTFAQRVPDTERRHLYPIEWDNAALIPITTFDDWWNKLPQIARRNVRTAAKKGITVRVIPFDDNLIAGIVHLYNESPVRLGKPFWHYGKDFETVKRENSTFADRSTFLGAFYGDQLVGFIKMVHVDNIASIMQIIAMVAHQDKRTTNAMISKAVEVCSSAKMSHLMYCKYVYGANDSSPLTDFKRRNGFEQVRFPRYYVPLTTLGRVAVAFGLQHGIRGILPAPALKFALRIREQYYQFTQRGSSETE